MSAGFIFSAVAGMTARARAMGMIKGAAMAATRRAGSALALPLVKKALDVGTNLGAQAAVYLLITEAFGSAATDKDREAAKRELQQIAGSDPASAQLLVDALESVSESNSDIDLPTLGVAIHLLHRLLPGASARSPDELQALCQAIVTLAAAPEPLVDAAEDFLRRTT